MRMRRGVWAAVVAASATIGAADARAAEAFPPALDPQTVKTWLAQELGVPPEQVIAVSPSAVTRLVSVSGEPGGRRSAVVEAQALTAETATRAGVVAWRMSLEVACVSGQVRLGPTSGYLSRVVSGPGTPLRPAEGDWRTPPPGSQLDSIRRAACAARTTPPPPAPAEPVKLQLPPPPPKIPPQHASDAPASTVSDAVAQVISTPDMAEAAKVLGRLKARFEGPMTGRETRIVPASLGGRTVYRGLVSGFESRRAARDFCAALEAGRQSCLVRQAPGGRPLKPVATR